MSIDYRQKHLMRLIYIGADDTGWAPVSDAVWPLLKIIPSELAETRDCEMGKFARLTHDGEVVRKWA